MTTRRRLFLLIAVGLLAGPRIALAAGERIANLDARIMDRKIVVSGELTQWFSRRIEEDLGHGIAKDLFFYLVLKRRQTYWYDEEIISKTIQRTIRYDLLTKRYLVTTRPDPLPPGAKSPPLQDRPPPQATFEDLSATRALLSHVDRVTLAGSELLKPGETYTVSMKAEMRASRIPRYLEYFLFFIPFLDVSTPWADSPPLSAASP